MIISIEEARNILRVDGTELDIEIINILESIPPYLEVTTGYSWDDVQPDPLAKTVARFILQLWFEDQGGKHSNDRLEVTINSLLGALSAKTREKENINEQAKGKVRESSSED